MWLWILFILCYTQEYCGIHSDKNHEEFTPFFEDEIDKCVKIGLIIKIGRFFTSFENVKGLCSCFINMTFVTLSFAIIRVLESFPVKVIPNEQYSS